MANQVLQSVAPPDGVRVEPLYEHEETHRLVTLVNAAAALILRNGEAAFTEFGRPGSRWREADRYIFVLDPDGNMLVHPDSAMEGTNQLGLTDIGGKPIIRGLVGAATLPGKPQGWYHYQWPVPGGLLPRWKSSYVTLVEAPSGRRYIVGSGIYNDGMERAFVIDMVADAVAHIEQEGDAAYRLLRDPAGPFIAKNAYVFVTDSAGIQLVNPGFPSLEGHSLVEMKDTEGKQVVRELLRVAQTSGSGWVDYMWPKPGESVSAQKSTYVSKASIGNSWVLVGCGVYLADAPKVRRTATSQAAPEIMTLVRDAAALLAQHGEEAFVAFRTTGSRWLHDDTYLFVWAVDGTCLFHGADPARQGTNDAVITDTLGRPFGRMFLDVASTFPGEGWVHYMYPEPGNVFPAWKSTFVKGVVFPSGRAHVVGAGVYNMQMNRTFVEDVVARAANLVAARGRDAFGDLRDKTGPFLFMDTYVFVLGTDGTELVNPAQPALEGKNLLDLKDLTGKAVAREEIAAALKDGSAWIDCYWYKPGSNTPAHKQAYVRKVDAGRDTFIVGSGVYLE